MPRSDRFYVFVVVGAASLLVLASIVAAIMTLTGKSDPRPGYESAPAKALVQPNPTSGSIVDPDNAERPPIDDETYLTLHRSSRLLSVQLAADRGWRQGLRRAHMPSEALAALTGKLSGFKGYLTGLRPSRRVVVRVFRPVPVPKPTDPGLQTAHTSTSILLTDPKFAGSEAGTLSFDFYWRLFQSGKSLQWRLEDVQPDLTKSDTTNMIDPTNPAEGGTESDLPEKPKNEPDRPTVPADDTPTSQTEY